MASIRIPCNFFAAAALLLPIQLAHSSEWQRLNGFHTISIDKASIERKDGWAKVWIRVEPLNALVLRAFDCQKKMAYVIEGGYVKNGTNVPPDSFDEALMQLVCRPN